MHPNNGTAGVQVKHNGAELDGGHYADDPQVGRGFLLAASGRYGKTRPDNVTIITENELIAFAREKRTMLPTAISRWLNRSAER